MRLLTQTAILGTCIGALVGISASPIAGTVVAALIASATLALSVIGGFAKSSDRADLPLPRQIDLGPLAVFALAVLIAAIAASVLRSKIIRVHSDAETVRALSAPPDVDRIIDSWVAIGRYVEEPAIGAATSEGESRDGGSPSTDNARNETAGMFSREEIAAWLLDRRTPSSRPVVETTTGVPIPLSSDEGTSLADSCYMRRTCEEGDEDCLRENFHTIKYQASEELSGIATALEAKDPEGEDLLDEADRNIILDKILELLCR